MSLLGYLAERERIEQGATKGPWEVDGCVVWPAGTPEGGRDKIAVHIGLASAEPTANFIADARTAVPTLIAMVREATEALESVQHNRGCSCYRSVSGGPCARCALGYDEVDAALARIEGMAK